jgi:hypothetical protein
MPCLTAAIVTKKDNVSTPKCISTPKSGIPPDLLSALELLFFLEEQRTGAVAPTPAWFLAEAFASQQQRNFKATPALQNFLHGLLGPSYQGAAAISTYYVTCVMALVLKAVGDVESWRTVGTRCEWCLMHWGVRTREAYIRCTEAWIVRTMEKWKGTVGTVGNSGNPNGATHLLQQGHEIVGILQKRAAKLGRLVETIHKR